LVAAISLALAIEGGQVAFGYGFDWIDIFDLAFDAAGIVLGIRAYGKIQGMRASRARS
jgi:glycopeptide antibiotics resistance protein